MDPSIAWSVCVFGSVANEQGTMQTEHYHKVIRFGYCKMASFFLNIKIFLETLIGHYKKSQTDLL